MLTRTPLYDAHVAAGARMVDFAGWEMPVQYGGILDEVRAVRSRAGLFDVSHMGEVRVTGPPALDAVQNLLTNDASKLNPGRAQYSLMCQDDGGVLDDLIVYRWDEGASHADFLIVVNASNRESDFQWMSGRGACHGAAFADVSDDYALIALQGPEAERMLATHVSSLDLAAMRPFSHGPAAFDRAASIHVARTGYTGEDGFELFCAPGDAAAVWNALSADGATPCGLGARDVLRIEASYPLYGHEISRETNPLEAGLGWVVKPAKGGFVGRDAIEKRREGGLQRKLVGLLPDDARAIPRQGAVISTSASAGIVTSGTYSPTLERAIGIAYAPAGAEGAATVAMRGKEMPANIVNLPFYKRGRQAATERI